MTENSVISTKQISKTYGNNQMVLSDVSFSIAKGEIVGLIGKNGSGKSTLLKILSGYIKPSSGIAKITGKSIGIIDIGSGFHPDLSGVENIRFILEMNSWAKRPGIQEEIRTFSELGESINKPVKTYSSGMFMRLALSTYLMMHFPVLFIDEIFSTGDIAFQHKVRDYIHSIKGKVSILLASHDLQLISSFADRCIWMDRGEIFQIGVALDVVEQYVENHFYDLFGNGRWLSKNVIRNVYVDEYIEIRELSLIQDEKNDYVVFDQDFQIQMKIYSKHTGKISFAARIQDLNAREIHIDSPEFQLFDMCMTGLGYYNLNITYPKSLFSSGKYKLSMIFWVDKEKVIEVSDIACFELKMKKEEGAGISFEIHTVSRMPLAWELVKE